jgi:hypothetical protein
LLACTLDRRFITDVGNATSLETTDPLNAERNISLPEEPYYSWFDDVGEDVVSKHESRFFIPQSHYQQVLVNEFRLGCLKHFSQTMLKVTCRDVLNINHQPAEWIHPKMNAGIQDLYQRAILHQQASLVLSDDNSQLKKHVPLLVENESNSLSFVTRAFPGLSCGHWPACLIPYHHVAPRCVLRLLSFRCYRLWRACLVSSSWLLPTEPTDHRLKQNGVDGIPPMWAVRAMGPVP